MGYGCGALTDFNEKELQMNVIHIILIIIHLVIIIPHHIDLIIAGIIYFLKKTAVYNTQNTVAYYCDYITGGRSQHNVYHVNTNYTMMMMYVNV